MTIGMIGFGNMARAIARGLHSSSLGAVHAAAPSLPVGINPDGVHTHTDNQVIAARANILILAVKPIQMADVLTQIKSSIRPDCLVISIAAGLNLAWLGTHLAPRTAIVRAMPNIAASIGQSATPLMANEYATKSQKENAALVFESIGMTTWADDECAIDAYTALSGSGPAYVFLFMEAMVKAGVALGLDEDIATSFTLQTVKGAVNLALDKNESLEQLRKSVTSPAGTTAAAIQVFTEEGLNTLVLSAMIAARDRAHALGMIKD